METKPTAKGSYQIADVAFKNLSFGKVESKKIISFNKDTAQAFSIVSAATPGSKYEVTQVKNDKGYLDWVSMVPSDAAAPPPTQSAVPAAYARTQAGSSTPTVRNTYETPEERAAKQVYIVRQSSLSAAINLLGVGSKTSPKVADVIETAKEFEAYVFGREATPTTDGGDVMDMMDDVPL